MKPRRWSAQEVALLRALYANTSSSEIAAQLGMTLEQVYAKAYKLRLRKTREYLQHTAAGRLRGNDARGRPFQFRPGNKPWNKGLLGMAPLSPDTTFRTGVRMGQALHNWMPVGSLRVNSDGYLVRKIADITGASQHHNWRSEHRIVWEAAHGPVPPGHAVIFKPGRRTVNVDEITPDALELVSRADLMRRNSYQKYPPELRKVIQLRGALNRIINRNAGQDTPADQEPK